MRSLNTPQHLGVSFSKGPKYTGYEAFRQVIEQGINAQLFMAGEGVLKDAVEAYAMQHQLSDRVKMLGFLPQEQLLGLYAVSDLFVLPSEYETFGAVVLEAMASGLPIITTNRVGAAYDLIEESVNGYIIPWDNVEVLAEAMCRVLSDEATCKRMGAASLVRLKDWNIEVTIEGYRRAVYGVLSMDNNS